MLPTVIPRIAPMDQNGPTPNPIYSQAMLKRLQKIPESTWLIIGMIAYDLVMFSVVTHYYFS